MARVKKFYIMDIRNVPPEYRERFNIYDTDIYISEQKTGFGVKRFMVCPYCGKRRERLYIVNESLIYCRTCLPNGLSIYKGLTHSTDGGTREIEYRMKRAAHKYKIPIRKWPFSYIDVLFDRPKYYRIKKWDEGLRVLQILENLRTQTIFYSNTYKPEIIDRLIKGHLYDYSLPELEKWLYNWYEVAARPQKAIRGD